MSDDFSRETNPLERFALAASVILYCAHTGQEFCDSGTMGRLSRDENLVRLGDLRAEAVRFFHDRGVPVTEAGTVLERVWRACWTLRDAAVADRDLLAYEREAREALRRFDELRGIVEHAPANEELPRSRPGRRGYCKKVLRHARQLRKNNPLMKVAVIRKKCREKFPDEEMPEDDHAFRSWMVRKHKKT
jgi:hypothetical protein